MNGIFKKIENWKRLLSNDIGVDLGTANTLVYLRGKGVIINEPSVVAVNIKTGRVVAIGKDAKDMAGRTPPHIVAVKPIVDGVISDFEITEEMLSYLLRRAEVGVKKFLSPRVVVGVPSNITNVEIRAVRDAARNAGAGEVYIVEEPMAAAIGLRLPIKEAIGSMVIDIGGGTADIAVISLAGTVASKNVRIAGEKLNSDIALYVRNEFKILIGEKTAENIKINIASLLPLGESIEFMARGRDLVTGLPREVMLTEDDVRESITHSISSLVASVKEVLEMTPPEIVGDIMHRGIHLVGGGALIKGLKELLEDELSIEVHIAPDPLTTVVRGTGIILENLEEFKEVLISDDYDIQPKK
jgi:rod shape-determining protein MreB and related proteins